jgi:hypothetical protein
MLILLVTGATLAVFLYVGGMFLQGYIYTEPSRDINWQAPAAGAALMVFLMLWCFLDANAADASPRELPYDTLFRFSANVDLLKEPAKEIWAIKKDGEKKPYTLRKVSPTSYRYVDPTYSPERPWRDDGVESLQIVIGGETYQFDRVKLAAADKKYAGYLEYLNDKGWVIKDYGDGPTSIPSKFRLGRLVMNLLLNFGFLLVWWLSLWLIMRFQWSHALLLAIVMWLVFLLTVMPMLLGYAGEVAEQQAMGASAVSRARQYVHDVPVLDDVSLALQPIHPMTFSFLHRPQPFEILVGDNFSPHETA